MIFETTRDGALKKLDDFIENEIINYNSKRNFDLDLKKEKMFHVYLHILLTD